MNSDILNTIIVEDEITSNTTLLGEIPSNVLMIVHNFIKDNESSIDYGNIMGSY